MSKSALDLKLAFLIPVLMLIQGCGSSADPNFAAGEQASPAYSIPAEMLEASLACESDLALDMRSPVLLVHATTVDPEINFAWNWMPVLRELQIPFCTVTLPNYAMTDIQESAEYVVYAIREMYRRGGRKVQIVGHSQGGLVPRWALRWWPDTRAMVDDLVAMGSPNHGSVVVTAICLAGCAPALQQQASDSDFVTALNADGETFAGISYTNIYSRLDEFVQPNLDDSGSTSLQTGEGMIRNVALQDVCPLDVSEHLIVGTSSSAGYEIAMDALMHEGPADIDRVDRAACSRLLMPGVNPATFATDFSAASAQVVLQLALYPHTFEEPPLKCYVTGSCAD